MPHTCRESCGVCGLLSTTNKEEQVVKGKSYTDLKRDNFECGQFKKLCENEKNCDDAPTDTEKTRSKRQAEEEDDEFRVFSYNKGSLSFRLGGIFCGATIISDRYSQREHLPFFDSAQIFPGRSSLL